MAEEYSGVKFRTVYLEKMAPEDLRIDTLRQWCSVFHQKGLAPSYPGGSYGNLSFRLNEGENNFIITGTCIGLKDCLGNNSFVEVVDCSTIEKTISVKGLREPSSESMLHFSLYAARKDIHAIFHGHCTGLIDAAERLGIPLTKKEQAYGSPELAAEAVNCGLHHNFFIARQHGFFALGKDMEEAGNLSLHRLNML